jgi:hypothetical protein
MHIRTTACASSGKEISYVRLQHPASPRENLKSDSVKSLAWTTERCKHHVVQQEERMARGLAKNEGL